MAKDVRVDIRSTLDGKGFEDSEAGFDKTAAAAKRAKRPIEEVEASANKLDRTLIQLAKRATVVFLGFKAGQLIQETTLLNARLETLDVVLEQVGRNAGFNRDQMFGFAEEVRSMGITLIQSRQAVIGLAQSQIDLTKAGELARIAQDAAVIGNINSSEALNRLVHGIRTQQVEVLRTIGINVSFEQAFARLANQLGKNVDELTKSERAQAGLNAVMEAGSGIAGIYDTAMDTAGKQLRSMDRLAEDAKVKLGALFQESLIVGVQVFTDLLKDTNSELDSMMENGEINGKGELLADTLAFIADSALSSAAAFRSAGGAIAFYVAAVEAIGPGFTEKFKALQEKSREDLDKLLASMTLFRDALERMRTDRRNKPKSRGQSAGTEFNAQTDELGTQTPDKLTADEKFLASLYSNLNSAKLAEIRQQIKLVNTEHREGRISNIKHAEAILFLTDAYEKLDPAAKRDIEQAKERKKLEEDRLKAIEEDVEAAQRMNDLRLESQQDALDADIAQGEEFRRLHDEQTEARLQTIESVEAYINGLRNETVIMQSSERARRHMLDGIYLESTGLEAGSQAWRDYMATIDRVREVQDRVNESFTLGANRAFEKYMNEVRNVAGQTENLFTRSFENMEDAMVDWLQTGSFSMDQFGKDFEAMVYRMIVQQQLLGPLAQAAAGGLSFLTGGSSTDPLANQSSAFATGHAGAVAGIEATGRRFADPAVFAGAQRYHRGGLVDDEVPIIARRGEGVFTPEQMKRLAPADGERSVRVEIINNGTPQQVTSAQPTFDLNGVVVRVVTQDMKAGGPISRSVQSTFGVRRSAG